MNETIKIRRAMPRDIPAVERLLCDICALHCKGRPDLFRMNKKYDAQKLTGIFENPQTPVFVADMNGDIVGYSFCIIKVRSGHPVMNDLTTLYVDDICVDEKLRGNGIGHRLFDEVKKLAASVGAYNIDLNVWSFNQNAVNFYESLGMKPSKITMELIVDQDK